MKDFGLNCTTPCWYLYLLYKSVVFKITFGFHRNWVIWLNLFAHIKQIITYKLISLNCHHHRYMYLPMLTDKTCSSLFGVLRYFTWYFSFLELQMFYKSNIFRLYKNSVALIICIIALVRIYLELICFGGVLSLVAASVPLSPDQQAMLYRTFVLLLK